MVSACFCLQDSCTEYATTLELSANMHTVLDGLHGMITTTMDTIGQNNVYNKINYPLRYY